MEFNVFSTTVNKTTVIHHSASSASTITVLNTAVGGRLWHTGSRWPYETGFMLISEWRRKLSIICWTALMTPVLNERPGEFCQSTMNEMKPVVLQYAVLIWVERVCPSLVLIQPFQKPHCIAYINSGIFHSRGVQEETKEKDVNKLKVEFYRDPTGVERKWFLFTCVHKLDTCALTLLHIKFGNIPYFCVYYCQQIP